MTYSERINAKANEIELLTAYANGVTGVEDANIGDAVKTLCDGYGQGGGDATIYYSSTGVPYTETFAINIGYNNASEYLAIAMKDYGIMPMLKKLIISGYMRAETTGAILSTSGTFYSSKLPALEELVIVPNKIRNNNNTGDLTEFSFGHYEFSKTNLKRLTLGSIGMRFKSSGYYRNDLPVPPGTSSYNIGSKDGLELIVYSDGPLLNGGFGGTLAPNTTYINYDWLTGERLN